MARVWGIESLLVRQQFYRQICLPLEISLMIEEKVWDLFFVEVYADEEPDERLKWLDPNLNTDITDHKKITTKYLDALYRKLIPKKLIWLNEKLNDNEWINKNSLIVKELSQIMKIINQKPTNCFTENFYYFYPLLDGDSPADFYFFCFLLKLIYKNDKLLFSNNNKERKNEEDILRILETEKKHLKWKKERQKPYLLLDFIRKNWETEDILKVLGDYWDWDILKKNITDLDAEKESYRKIFAEYFISKQTPPISKPTWNESVVSKIEKNSEKNPLPNIKSDLLLTSCFLFVWFYFFVLSFLLIIKFKWGVWQPGKKKSYCFLIITNISFFLVMLISLIYLLI